LHRRHELGERQRDVFGHNSSRIFDDTFLNPWVVASGTRLIATRPMVARVETSTELAGIIVADDSRRPLSEIVRYVELIDVMKNRRFGGRPAPTSR
jgi:hypothetical protein